MSENFVELANCIDRQAPSGDVRRSYNIAKATVSIFRNMILSANVTSFDELISTLRKNSQTLLETFPDEPVVENMARRCIRIGRDEYVRRTGKNILFSIKRHAVKTPQRRISGDTGEQSLEMDVVSSLNELSNEMEVMAELMSDLASSLFTDGDTILTIGNSFSTGPLLKQASREKKRVRIVVAQSESNGSEVDLVRSLPSRSVTVVPSAAVFALMPRLSKLLIGAQHLMADGSVVATSGAYGLALVADYYKVPIIVTAANFEISPTFVNKVKTCCRLGSPHSVLPFGQLASHGQTGLVNAYNHSVDVIPARLVHLYVTVDGCHPLSSFRRLVSEMYSNDDWDLAVKI